MILANVVERLTRTVSGAIATDESRWDWDYVLSLIDSASAWAKSEHFRKNKAIPSQWAYTFEVPYNKDYQNDDCVTKYPISEYIVLPEGFNGILQIKAEKGTPYTIYNSRNIFNNVCNSPQLNPTASKGGACYIDGNVVCIASNDTPDKLLVNGLFVNVLSDQTFNQDFDTYPITDDLMWMMGTYIIKQYMGDAAIRPIDKVDTGNERILMKQ